VEKYGRARQATDDNIIGLMLFAWLIAKAKDTHSEYVILIVFPRERWLRERASILRYTCIACLVRLCPCKVFALFSTILFFLSSVHYV
jgi:hypothetical protein